MKVWKEVARIEENRNEQLEVLRVEEAEERGEQRAQQQNGGLRIWKQQTASEQALGEQQNSRDAADGPPLLRTAVRLLFYWKF